MVVKNRIAFLIPGANSMGFSESEFHLLSSSGFDLAIDIEILCIQRMTMVGWCLRAFKLLFSASCWSSSTLKMHKYRISKHESEQQTFSHKFTGYNLRQDRISCCPTVVKDRC